MFVGARMSHPVITVSPDTSVHDALAMFRNEHIRRAPVLKDGEMVGIVSERDLLNASPSPVSSLTVWEMNYLISKVTVKDVMSKHVKCVDSDTPIEEAARIMADSKIGGLPVVEHGKVVGIITETDLFKIFLELMGARQKAMRATVLVEDKPGALAKVTKAIAEAGGDFIAFGMFSGPDSSSKIVTFKVAGMEGEAVTKALSNVIQKVQDLRQS